MSKNFYNRMMKSTRRLHDPEPQKDQLVADTTFELYTPSSRRTRRRAYRRNTAVGSKINRETSTSRIQKARSITTKTLNNLLYASFDYRKNRKPICSGNKEYEPVSKTEKRQKRTNSK